MVGGEGLIGLKPMAAFDPLREKVVKHHLRVIISALPFPFWNKRLLEGIANTIGRFVALEEDFMSVFDKRKAKVLVEMDISQGLPSEVDILCQDRLYT